MSSCCRVWGVVTKCSYQRKDREREGGGIQVKVGLSLSDVRQEVQKEGVGGRWNYCMTSLTGLGLSNA